MEGFLLGPQAGWVWDSSSSSAVCGLLQFFVQRLELSCKLLLADYLCHCQVHIIVFTSCFLRVRVRVCVSMLHLKWWARHCACSPAQCSWVCWSGSGLDLFPLHTWTPQWIYLMDARTWNMLLQIRQPEGICGTKHPNSARCRIMNKTM